jgi:hypothetical protein
VKGLTAPSSRLLSGFPRGAAFGFTIGDIGEGSFTFTATRGGHTATAGASIPEAFNGASVRFQAGGYQEADSTVGGAGSDVGARDVPGVHHYR